MPFTRLSGALSPVLFALLLCGCRSNQAETSSSPAQILKLAVAGSYDRSADSRARMPDHLRRVTTWKTRAPIPARELRVTYDTDQRTVAWRLDLWGGAPLQKLAAATALEPLGKAGENTVYSVKGGPFDGALALRGRENVALLSRPYALRYERTLLRYAGP